MTPRARLIALSLTFLLSPGAAEAVENAVHIVRGHGPAHHDHDDEHHHDRDRDEHGCTATFHACGCCAHVVPTTVRAAGVRLDVECDEARVPPLPAPPVSAGRDATDDLLRPPIG